MVVDTQFHKFDGRPFARVLHLFLMKDIGRSLPWVPPGSTRRSYKDDVVHNHSAHGYNPDGGRGKICMIFLNVKAEWSDGTSKIDVRMTMSKLQVRGTPCKCCRRSQQRSSPGLRLRLTALLVSITRVWWIPHSLIASSSALDNIWQSILHTPVVEEVAGPRDICQAELTAIFPSGVFQQLFECLPQSPPDITYLVLLNKMRIRSVCVPKTIPWRKHNKLTLNDTADTVLQRHLQ